MADNRVIVELGTVIKNRGEWDSLAQNAKLYKDNVVQYNGSAYIVKSAPASGIGKDILPTNTAYYEVFAGVGEVATGSDFDAPSAAQRGKITTVGAVLDGMNDGVYNLTAKTGDSYATLNDAIIAANNTIPTNKKRGGMSICFVNSTGNKYVQYRLMADEWSTVKSDWQGVDDEPTAGSQNLIESGGVYNTQNIVSGILHDNAVYQNQNYYVTPYIPFGGGNSTWNTSEVNNNAYIEFYNSEFTRVNQNPASQETVSRTNAPTSYAYVRCCFKLNGIGNLVLNGVTVWDNSKVKYANVKERMNNDNNIAILLSRVDRLLSDGFLFGGYITDGSSPVVTGYNKTKLFYITYGAGNAYINFIDYNTNEPIIVERRTLAIIRTFTQNNIDTGKFICVPILSLSPYATQSEVNSELTLIKDTITNLIVGVPSIKLSDIKHGYLGTYQDTLRWLQTSNNRYNYVVLPVIALRGYKLSIVSNAQPRFAFLKQVDTPVLCEGTDVATAFPNNITIPEDANYIYVSCSSQDGTSTPILPDRIETNYKSIYALNLALKTKQDVFTASANAGVEITGIGEGDYLSIAKISRVNLLDPICKGNLYFNGSAGSYTITSNPYHNSNYIEVEGGAIYRIGGDLSGFGSSTFRYAFTSEVPAAGVTALSSGAVTSGTTIQAPVTAKYLLWTTGYTGIEQINTEAILSKGSNEVGYVSYVNSINNVEIVVADDSELTNQETVTTNENGIAYFDTHYPKMYVKPDSRLYISVEYPTDLKAYIDSHGGGGSEYVTYSNGRTQVGDGTPASELPSQCISVGANNLTNATGTKNITIGNDNLGGVINTSGSDVYSGCQGTENVSIGYHALFRNYTGNHNTGIGSEAGDDNTIGGFNTAVGSHSLQRNNKGDGNVAVGYRALLGSSTTYAAGGGNRKTDYNVAIGYDALNNLTGGYSNVAIGAEALKQQQSTRDNVAIGNGALGGNTQVSSCVAIGKNAGKQADGGNQFWVANSDTDKEHALIFGIFSPSDLVNALLRFNAGKILMPNLPTSDPQVAGQLWNDNGTLKISSGS